MNNVSRLPSIDPFSARNLALIQRTVAIDCNEAEFDMFLHVCRHLGLDPLRKQIYAFVFGKKAKDQSKRKMSIITAIDGFRVIAERTENYRPDEDEPTYEIDQGVISPHNPAGLVKAVVRVFKFSHGAWHRVTASAYWTEYAPLKEGWSETVRVEDGTWPDGNPKFKEKPAPGAVKTTVLDDSGNWAKMPRLMLAKVAEALALRKGWPDNFSGVYVKEEMDRAMVLDLSPSEAAAAGAAEQRMEKIGAGNSILVDWLDEKALDPVPIGKFADRAMEFITAHKDEPSTIGMWESRNRHGLRSFWASSPGDALAIKKEIEIATTARIESGSSE